MKILKWLIFSIVFIVFPVSGTDDFDFMHNASFKFNQGVPFIRAHVKKYGKSLKVSEIKGFRCGEKKVLTPEITVSVVKFSKGETKYKLAFTEIALSKLSNYKMLAGKWEEMSGLKTEIYVNGAVFSINTTKIDNREYFITAADLYDKGQAEKKLSFFRKKFPGENIFIIPVMTKATRSLLNITAVNGKTHKCSNLVSIDSNGSFSVGTDSYESRGEFFITASSLHTLDLAVEESVEHLVEKILPGEMFLSAPLETLKAQAVAARTDIFMQLGKRHVSEPWHICSEVHCQKISWGQKIDQKFIKAVKETEGMVIIHNGSHIARAPYCSSAGGRTEDIRNVWFTAEKPYLSGVWDGDSPLALDLSKEADLLKFLESDYGEDNIKINRKHRWKKVFKTAELDEIVNKSLNIGKVEDIVPLNRGVSGRIFKVLFKGEKGEQTVYGELNIRRILDNMYSSAFLIRKSEGEWEFSGMG